MRDEGDTAARRQEAGRRGQSDARTHLPAQRRRPSIRWRRPLAPPPPRTGTAGYFLIADEAHSSQSGRTATKLKEILSTDTSEDREGLTAEEMLEASVKARGDSPNISYYAFTATPGKSGEAVRSLLLKQECGVPMPPTLMALVVERVTDGTAVLLLLLIS